MIILLRQQQMLKLACDSLFNLLQVTKTSLKDTSNEKKKQIGLDKLLKELLADYSIFIQQVPDTLRSRIENWKNQNLQQMIGEIAVLVTSLLYQQLGEVFCYYGFFVVNIHADVLGH